MIVGTAFPSDRNDLLKAVQHALYARQVSRLFAVARRVLVGADELLDAQALIAERARATEQFDHRVLQDAHDIMAAAFRHRHDDGGQFRLLETEADRAERYRAAWSAWFEDELAALAEAPRFVRSTVFAVVLARTEPGQAAEHDLCTLLVERYELRHWGCANGYAESYPARVDR